MFDDFKPDQKNIEIKTPYFDDCNEKDGWQGHTTGKDLPILTAEITAAVARFGGEVMSVMRGRYGERMGMRILYNISDLDGKIKQGRLDIVALPIKKNPRYRSGQMNSEAKREEQSLKMALFNMRDILNGMWRLQHLSPGYSALMPWMLTDTGQTVSQVWNSRRLLPVPEAQFES